ncbi:hypothetical protein JAAARDRAFT_245756 [Jaapia argillacea MUCL 33604]|uniref:Uncharacterized protein n=1 Tax=Jaapia argillacea MUCL 33604 TaxID=933084 RepID=A0A067QQS4_9AGAM|nr:hypothetical protein JAAARDRAFT_245756 [Jaapia argillacea MUCL 33604]
MPDPPPPPATQDDIVVHVRTELQSDFDAQSSPFPSGSLSAIALTSSVARERPLNIYYINDGAVFNAYQDPNLATTGSPPWSIEDMLFPGSAPNLIRAVSIPNSTHDMVLVVTQDALKAYLVEVGPRFPKWTVVPPPVPSGHIIDCSLFVTSSNQLQMAFQVSGRIYLADPTTVLMDGWNEDVGVRGYFQAGVSSFSAQTSLGSSINESYFGYAVASKAAGLSFISGGSFDATQPAILTEVDKSGVYTTVWAVPLPGDSISSKPLLFAGDSMFNTYYFQPNADSTYTKVQIFVGKKVNHLEAVVRYRRATASGITELWAEVFGLDDAGTIHHLESAYDDVKKANKFVLLSTGDYAVTAWRASDAPISLKDTAISSTPSSDGNASLLVYSQSTSGNTLRILSQDKDTSDWITEKVALPASSMSKPVVKKLRVYYVEATLMDKKNLVPQAGLAAVISSSQFAAININGRVVGVDDIRTATAFSNNVGRICFTLDATNNLGVATFSIWVEGMPKDKVIDIKPNGAIQSKLMNLTVDKMRKAVDQDSPGKPQCFPASQVTDAQLKEAIANVNKVMGVVDPSFEPLTSPPSKDESHLPSRHHLYHRTLSTVARTRLHHEPSLGHIRHIHGRARHKVEINFPHGPITRLGDGILDFSWGDLWRTIKNKFYALKQVILEPIADGVKATIRMVKDAVEYVWNGIIKFVQQAYDVVAAIFEAIGTAFKTIFGWLMYYLDFDDIKKTAASFQKTITDFQDFGQKLFGEALPTITKGGFAKAKTWLQANITAAENALQGQTVKTYDHDLVPGQGLEAFGDGQGVLDDLPSSATWLMNKIFNAAGGDAGTITFTNATTTFERLWAKFTADMDQIGFGDDLKKAYESLKTMLVTFRDRGIFDSTSWVSLLEVAKAFIFVVLDVAELAALSVESLIAEAFNFFMDILNEPLDIPVVSWVFEEITGVKLTVINTVTFIIAIPFTIAYKVVMGKTPFLLTNETGHGLVGDATSDEINMRRGLIMILNGLWVSATDFFQGQAAATVKTASTQPQPQPQVEVASAGRRIIGNQHIT